VASSYTTNLGIEQPATGEQSGTWGATTNTNFDILDQAIDGIISINLSSAGSSGSPNPLPISDGAVSNGRNKFIEFTDSGDLGATVYVQLTPDNAEKVVHIRNSLSGSRSILIFQGTYNTGRDFEIGNGKDVLLKFSGGGSSSATVTDVYANLAVTKIDATTLAIGGTNVTSTAAELNILDGVTATNTELNLLDGVTATTDELNFVDTTAGTVAASKAIVVDANKDTSGARNITATGIIASTADGATALQLGPSGHFTAEVDSSNRLVFKFNGTVIMRLSSAGALETKDNITAYQSF
jgi:hypothetical protein